MDSNKSMTENKDNVRLLCNRLVIKSWLGSYDEAALHRDWELLVKYSYSYIKTITIIIDVYRGITLHHN